MQTAATQGTVAHRHLISLRKKAGHLLKITFQMNVAFVLVFFADAKQFLPLEIINLFLPKL